MSGTREQPTGQKTGSPSVEEMLVSIRQAIHGDNAKNVSKNNTNNNAPIPSSRARPPSKPVSGSMRQTRVSLGETRATRISPSAKASVHNNSNNFQKLKKQLHDLDPLLGRQGTKRVAEDRARGSANGFAGILNGDVKLEEALAKLERAGLGQEHSLTDQADALSQIEPPQMRGVEDDGIDEYDFDHQHNDVVSAEVPVEVAPVVEPTYSDAPTAPELRQSDYEDYEPTYREELYEPAPVAPPIAAAPLAPPPAPHQPSYGYTQEPQAQPLQTRPQMYNETYAEPVPEAPQQIPVAPMPVAPVIAHQDLAHMSTGLTSPQNAQVASDAFATLAETIMHQASIGNRSIDDLTKELLHPMLKGWLDENLPRMVERLIREEIERVARGGAR